jgi:UDP:flavonoid glycosyltransferase YjiC (YdhE family)
VLITPFCSQLPSPLPRGVFHAEFVPFEYLLPRAAALVHHGGIGTASQAIAAGIPQLLRPMSMDQPDNTIRVCRLGVGDYLTPKEYRPAAVARALSHLTTSSLVKSSCRHWAAQVRPGEAIRQTCDLVERLYESHSVGDIIKARSVSEECAPVVR